MPPKISSLERIPRGFRLQETTAGTFLVPKSKKGKSKMPKEQRDRIRAAARKMKVPLLTAAAIGVPVFSAMKFAKEQGGDFQRKAFMFSREILSSYTGIQVSSDGTTTFKLERMQKGLLPLAILTGVKRLGIFRGANTGLTKARLPFLLG